MNFHWQALREHMTLAALIQALNRRMKILEQVLGIGGDFVAFVANDATPSVGAARRFKTANTSATTITAFDDARIGQEIVVLIDDANTTVDFTGTTLTGNGGSDWSPGDGDYMTCVYDGTNWRCQITEV